MDTKFADDQIAELLRRTAKGESLLSICDDPKMPGRSTVYDWIDADPEFAGQFRTARARGIHGMVDECLKIADEKVDKDDSVAVANKRVRIDTRLRLAGKWLPKDYGDKIDVNYNAEVTHRHDLSGLATDELDALEALVAKAADASRDQGGESAQKPHQLH